MAALTTSALVVFERKLQSALLTRARFIPANQEQARESYVTRLNWSCTILAARSLVATVVVVVVKQFCHSKKEVLVQVYNRFFISALLSRPIIATAAAAVEQQPPTTATTTSIWPGWRLFLAANQRRHHRGDHGSSNSAHDVDKEAISLSTTPSSHKL